MFRGSIIFLALFLVLGMFTIQAFGQDSTAPSATIPGVSEQTVPTQEEVKLQYKFIPGELVRYKMVMNMDINMKMDMPEMGPKGAMQLQGMNMQMVMVLRQRTTKVFPNGDAEITAALETLKIVDPKGKTVSMPTQKVPTFKIVMGKNGMVKDFKGLEKFQKSMPGMAGKSGIPGLDLNSYSRMMGQYAPFPDTPIKIGDSWTIDMPIPMGGKFNIVNQLLNIVSTAGKSTAAIKQDITGDIGYRMETPKGTGKQAGKVTIDTIGNMDGTVNVDFSVNKGRVTSTTGNIGMHMTMNMASQGVNTQAGTMAVDMVMELQMFELPAGK